MGPDLPTLEMAVATLVDGGRCIAASAFKTEVPTLTANEPGLYLWWADEQGRATSATALGCRSSRVRPDGGEAGATVGLRRSTATLGSRIARNHLGGTIRGSTFRWTLAAILRTALRLEPIDGRHMTTDSEARVSAGSVSTWA